MSNIVKLIENPYRIVASMASRGKLLWLNEKIAIKLIYRGQMKKKIDINNPITFNEKLQWLKLYDHNPLYTELVDKYEVRKYIKKWLGNDYLVPAIGVWDAPEDINFESLPPKFVIKCTHDSGSTVVCRDKLKLNKEALIKHLRFRMKRSHYWAGREWPYKNVKPRIIAEMFMDSGDNLGLTDYKFYCFNGNPEFLYISTGLENHETAHISFFDLAGNFMPFRRADYSGFEVAPTMPLKFEEMKEIAALCAEKIGSDFLRVDLYQIGDRVYFSEFTFTPCGGYMKFVPEEYDRKIGDLLELNRGNNHD